MQVREQACAASYAHREAQEGPRCDFLARCSLYCMVMWSQSQSGYPHSQRSHYFDSCMARCLCARSQLSWSSAVSRSGGSAGVCRRFLGEASNVILLTNKRRERLLLHTATGVNLRNTVEQRKSVIPLVRSFDCSLGIDVRTVIAREVCGLPGRVGQSFPDDGDTLHLDRIGSYNGVYICQNKSSYTCVVHCIQILLQ